MSGVKLKIVLIFMGSLFVLMLVYLCFLFPYGNLERASEAKREIGIMLLTFNSVKKQVEKEVASGGRADNVFKYGKVSWPFKVYADDSEIVIVGEYAVIVLKFEVEPVERWKFSAFTIAEGPWQGSDNLARRKTETYHD
jgi:hypothetical protein